MPATDLTHDDDDDDDDEDDSSPTVDRVEIVTRY